MDTGKYSKIPFGVELKTEDLKRLMTDTEWEEFQKELASTPEEVEEILRGTDWLDINEVNRLLEITDEELAGSAVTPPLPGPQPAAPKLEGNP
jgi:hypothetical protein